jgi:hypothetical protein
MLHRIARTKIVKAPTPRSRLIPSGHARQESVFRRWPRASTAGHLLERTRQHYRAALEIFPMMQRH